jgi:hypothetical protein
MKTNQIAQQNFGGLIEFPSSVNDADSGWMALRREQMNISANSIFPRRGQRIFRINVATLKSFLFATVHIFAKI